LRVQAVDHPRHREEKVRRLRYAEGSVADSEYETRGQSRRIAPANVSMVCEFADFC